MANKNNEYSKTAKLLIKALGGNDNIVSAIHCVSRVRLVVKDPSIIDVRTIENLPYVKGYVNAKSVGQIHIVIGPDVANFYQSFMKEWNHAPIVDSSKKEPATASNQKWWQKLLRHFAEIFVPLIPALVAGGLILGFRNILEAEWTGKGSALKDISVFANGLNDFLWIPAQAVFFYIPVTICWSIFKKMDGSPVLGIIIGLSLLLPPLENIYAISSRAGGSLWIFNIAEAFDFGIWKFPWKIQYTGQVIPAIGVAFFGVYLERAMKKITPAVLKQIFVPLVTILGAFVVGLCIIGPLGYLVGAGISIGLSWALTNSIAKYFFAPIIGLLYAPIVITGVHTMFNAIMIQDTSQLGGTFLFPILCISNIAQGTATLMFTLTKRRNERIKETGVSATISAYLGVTEPAMYGINLRFLYPFFAAIIASAAGSLLLVVAGVTSNGIGNGGLLGVLSIQPFSSIKGVSTFPGTGYTWFVCAILLTVILTTSLTYFFGKLPKFKKMTHDLLNVKLDANLMKGL